MLARQGVTFILLGGISTYAYGVAGLYLLDSHFRQATTLAESWARRPACCS